MCYCGSHQPLIMFALVKIKNILQLAPGLNYIH